MESKRCQKKREVMNYKILNYVSVRIRALKIWSAQCYEVNWIPFIGRHCNPALLLLFFKVTFQTLEFFQEKFRDYVLKLQI